MRKRRFNLWFTALLIVLLVFYHLSEENSEGNVINVLGRWEKHFISLFDELEEEKVCWLGQVERIYDGDTFGVYIYNTSQYERVRIKYVDYIDLHPKSRIEKWMREGVRNKSVLKRCYEEGNSILRKMIKGKYVCVVQEHRGERDKYGRLLGFMDVFLNENKTKLDVGEWVIRNGYAMPYLRFGKGERADMYLSIYHSVRRAHEGCLWNIS